MTPLEREQFEDMKEKVETMYDSWLNMKAQVSSIYNVVTGNDPYNKHKPLLERVSRLERSQWVVRVVIIAFGIGLFVGALVWGAITFRQFVEAVKTVK